MYFLTTQFLKCVSHFQVISSLMCIIIEIKDLFEKIVRICHHNLKR